MNLILSPKQAAWFSIDCWIWGRGVAVSVLYARLQNLMSFESELESFFTFLSRSLLSKLMGASVSEHNVSLVKGGWGRERESWVEANYRFVSRSSMKWTRGWNEGDVWCAGTAFESIGRESIVRSCHPLVTSSLPPFDSGKRNLFLLSILWIIVSQSRFSFRFPLLTLHMSPSSTKSLRDFGSQTADVQGLQKTKTTRGKLTDFWATSFFSHYCLLLIISMTRSLFFPQRSIERKKKKKKDQEADFSRTYIL